MKKTVLRYQVALFGNFDEIRPTGENIKFFIDAFSDRNFIPNQYTELNIEKSIEGDKTSNSRLKLNDSEKKWDIRLGSDRIDLFFVNSNIDVIELIDKDAFIKDVCDFVQRINNKYKNKYKRIGFATQYLYENIETEEIVKKLQNNISFFDGKPTIDFSTKIATRLKLNYKDELVNVSSSFAKLENIMRIKNEISTFDGFILANDLNTLTDNNDYRFIYEDLSPLLNELSTYETTIEQEITKKIQ